MACFGSDLSSRRGNGGTENRHEASKSQSHLTRNPREALVGGSEQTDTREICFTAEQPISSLVTLFVTMAAASDNNPIASVAHQQSQRLFGDTILSSLE